MDFFRRVFDQVRDLVQKMSTGQKLSLGLLLGTITLSVVLLFMWTTSEGLVPLYYSEIDITAVGEITNKLNELNIEHVASGIEFGVLKYDLKVLAAARRDLGEGGQGYADVLVA